MIRALQFALLAGSAIAPAIAIEPSLSIRPSFRIGDAGVLCTAQAVTLSRSVQTRPPCTTPIGL